LDAAALPPPDPRLRRWLQALTYPAYVFTNARRDWAERCLASMQMDDLLVENSATAVLRGILDIAFLGWTGKPEPSAFEAAERFVRIRHPEVTQVLFADDRLDNLETARERGWITVWVRPHTSDPTEGMGHHVVDSLADLRPESLP
jgi:FMN phosphatase YigB (HAD superfamily)